MQLNNLIFSQTSDMNGDVALPDSPFATENMSTTIRRVAVKFCPDIHGPQGIHLTVLMTPLAFYLELSRAGQNLN